MLSAVILILLTNIGSDCHARRDPFCSDLEDAQRVERQWLVLDASVKSPRSFGEPCVPGVAATVRAARSAALEKATAYRRYYERWLKLSVDSAKGFSEALARQADSRRAVEQLLAAAEEERTSLLKRMSALPKDDSSQRAINELVGQVQQRVLNLREALSRWADDRKSAEAATAGVREIRAHMQDAIRAVSAESVLWDAYYDGIATWNVLHCGGLE